MASAVDCGHFFRAVPHSQSVERDIVFISYSQDDSDWRGRLEKHLKPYVETQGLKVWTDQKIGVGRQWSAAIDCALRRTRVAVLLVSPNSLASDFVMNNEYPRLKRAAEKDGLTLIWVLISPCAYDLYDINDTQAGHDMKKPLNTLEPSALDAVLVEIAKKIAAEARKPIDRSFIEAEMLSSDLHDSARHVPRIHSGKSVTDIDGIDGEIEFRDRQGNLSGKKVLLQLRPDKYYTVGVESDARDNRLIPMILRRTRCGRITMIRCICSQESATKFSGPRSPTAVGERKSLLELK
jgi:hypothetical protein